MSTILCSLNYLHIALIAAVGFFLGGLWYSVLFGKAWMAEMKLTPEECKAKGKSMGRLVMVKCFLLTVVSTTVLACLIVDHGGNIGFRHGACLGAFVGLGLVACRSAVNDMFQFKSFKHWLIVSGHDVVLLTLQGALLTHWR